MGRALCPVSKHDHAPWRPHSMADAGTTQSHHSIHDSRSGIAHWFADFHFANVAPSKSSHSHALHIQLPVAGWYDTAVARLVFDGKTEANLIALHLAAALLNRIKRSLHV